VQSAIIEPRTDTVVEGDTIDVKVAYAPPCCYRSHPHSCIARSPALTLMYQLDLSWLLSPRASESSQCVDTASAYIHSTGALHCCSDTRPFANEHGGGCAVFMLHWARETSSRRLTGAADADAGHARRATRGAAADAASCWWTCPLTAAPRGSPPRSPTAPTKTPTAHGRGRCGRRRCQCLGVWTRCAATLLSLSLTHSLSLNPSLQRSFALLWLLSAAAAPQNPLCRQRALSRSPLCCVTLMRMGSQVELCCRATDAASNTQPPSAAPIWNMRGLANNSWHTVAVTMDR
jgi:hypothetical protein